MTFETWFKTFLEEKEIDLSEFVQAGDGSTLQLGDVCSMILSTGESEQAKIKNTLAKIDFYNASVTDYLKHLAKALNKSHRVAI